jgi:formate/nitrite transporter
MPPKQRLEVAPRKPFHVKLFKTPKETVLAICTAATNKASYRLDVLILLACLSGFWIGLGALSSLLAAGGLPNADEGVRRIVAGTTFSIGLMLVVTGTELFTSNVMFLMVGVMERKVSFFSLCRNWLVVWAFNFLASVLFAYLLAYLPGFFDDEPYRSYLRAVTEAKTTGTNWGILVLKGIGCNLLVCMSILVAAASEDFASKFLAIFFFISTFIIIGYEHCVANMTALTIGALYGFCDVGTMLAWNIIPVTIGNMIGGAFVAFAFWFSYLFATSPRRKRHKKGFFWNIIYGVPRDEPSIQQSWEVNSVPLN